jgi:ring-1,2-phenylacetyl-CoA epoxidase subunit PaaB
MTVPDRPARNPTDPVGSPSAGRAPERDWPLWEVFVRPARGLSHVHAGSLHAADDRMAIGNARDLYTRRGEGVSIWVVRSAAIVASSPDEKDALFDPAADKVYRHPTYFTASEGVPNL